MQESYFFVKQPNRFKSTEYRDKITEQSSAGSADFFYGGVPKKVAENRSA